MILVVNLRTRSQFKIICKKITKEDEEIIWNIDAETVIAKIHALTPSPGCYFYNNSDKLKIFECKLSDKKSKNPVTLLLKTKAYLLPVKINILKS